MSNPSDNPYYQPYQEPTGGGPSKSGETPGKVKAAAIALIVCGVLDALYGVLRIGGAVMMAGGNQAAQPELPPDAPPWLRQLVEQASNASPAFEAIMGFVMIALAAVIIFGGAQMMRMRSWGASLAGAIICMLPCVTCLGCCGVGEGIGIWALVVLLSEDVKSRFS